MARMTRHDLLTEDEIACLRAHLAQGWGRAAIRDRVLLELLLTTGMLVEELVALQVDDLDLPQATVRVCCPPSTVRVLPLSRRLCQLLPLYLAWRAAHGTGTAPHTRLFHRTRNILLVWETLGTLRYQAAIRHIHVDGASHEDALERL